MLLLLYIFIYFVHGSKIKFKCPGGDKTFNYDTTANQNENSPVGKQALQVPCNNPGCDAKKWISKAEIDHCSAPFKGVKKTIENKHHFAPACDLHDMCYRIDKKKPCDDRFKEDMKAICEDNKKNCKFSKAKCGRIYTNCKYWAWQVHKSVKRWGKNRYELAQFRGKKIGCKSRAGDATFWDMDIHDHIYNDVYDINDVNDGSGFELLFILIGLESLMMIICVSCGCMITAGITYFILTKRKQKSDVQQ